MRESVFKKVFLGKPDGVSIFKWIKLLLLEIYLGEQLLEMLSTTSSYNHENEEPRWSDLSTGWKQPLESFIPATLINKFLESHIVELLLTKYVSHYDLIKSFGGEVTDRKVDEGLYELKHKNIYLLTELKLAYNTIWVSVNVALDILVYIVTQDITSALLVGAFIEFIRRFKW